MEVYAQKHFWGVKNFDLFFQSECTVGGNFNNKSHINQVSKDLVSESVTGPGNEQTRKSNEIMMMSDYFDNVLRCGVGCPKKNKSPNFVSQRNPLVFIG